MQDDTDPIIKDGLLDLADICKDFVPPSVDTSRDPKLSMVDIRLT